MCVFWDCHNDLPFYVHKVISHLTVVGYSIHIFHSSVTACMQLNSPTTHFRCISFVSPGSTCLCVREICSRLAWFCPILTRWDKGISAAVNLFHFFVFIHSFIFNTFEYYYFFFRKSPFLWFYCFCMCGHMYCCVRSYCIAYRITSKRALWI